MSHASTDVTIDQIQLSADNLDARKAAAIYKEFGCLVVRGLMTPYIARIAEDVERVAQESIDLIPQAKKIVEGWYTPNGALCLPAPDGFIRDKQLMTIPYSYNTSAEFFRSALEPKTLDIAEAVLGPDIELFGNGQSLYKEPVGGHPKHLHQDAAYFEHKYEGPCATLNYVVDTNINNGCLHVVPGSFKSGLMKHVDTFSHLGLDEQEWPWERSLPIEGAAGDAIFFHVNCIHGSKPNYSDKGRPVFIHRYRRADDFIIIGGTTAENRAQNEKQAAQAKKDNQKGLMVRGFRKYDAQREM